MMDVSYLRPQFTFIKEYKYTTVLLLYDGTFLHET